ncbi:nickel pincer cofactor biosynthesis protein LarC [Neobacillus drentensis]|uniref:nickel pincer cofactor biosynthesis protein LarC n=1 Tax=Neobacillus drentensis TaxID=220684 RepID=UPI001F1DB589|nr:nickel pincer cofactor biosynthesis protein LarC [Neobacillus drentensis]ULT58982.1 nickel pincer cofactor biosynthesis protein LarC [Neobacillus drentensis]
MKNLYLDCISGIAGDMTLAALIDLGADLSYIVEQLRKLPIDRFEIEVHTVNKRGIAAKKLKIHFPSEVHEHHNGHAHPHEHRSAKEILSLIEDSNLPKRVKERSLAIFQEVARAEGKIHGTDPKEVHFHEAGAMDSIIETIGVCLALESLEIADIYASPVPTGYGKKRMAHGFYPIPAPATMELLKGIPLAELNVKGELTTPTGAGILRALVKRFMPIGGHMVEEIGYGAGEKDFDHPNVLRALLLTPTDFMHSIEGSNQHRESIYVIEAQLDDMTGEGLGYTLERLLAAGALDVFYTPVFMKKNRPGTLVTVLVSLELADDCEKVLLEETTTLGVRRSMWSRDILDRRFIEVETPYGHIKVKQAFRDNKMLHQAPEYEDVAKAARNHGVPFQLIYQYAMKLATD